MTADEFQTASIAILRTSVGWQTKIARKLGVEPRTVRRWLAAGVIPDWAADKMADMIGLATQLPWPRGEWLVGLDEAGRKLVCHLQPPRFTARIVMCDDAGSALPEESPADVISGTTYVVDGSDPEGDVVMCEIHWIDEPRAGEVTQLLDAAADAYERWEDM